MYIVLAKNPRKQWYFKVVASNGKILCHSESYSGKTQARNGARTLVRGSLYKDFRIVEFTEGRER